MIYKFRFKAAFLFARAKRSGKRKSTFKGDTSTSSCKLQLHINHGLPSSRHSRCGRMLKTCHRHVFLTHRQKKKHARGGHVTNIVLTLTAYQPPTSLLGAQLLRSEATNVPLARLLNAPTLGLPPCRRVNNTHARRWRFQYRYLLVLVHCVFAVGAPIGRPRAGNARPYKQDFAAPKI